MNSGKVLPGLKFLQKDRQEFSRKTQQMQQDLEDQFTKSLSQRGYGVKRGLGAAPEEY